MVLIALTLSGPASAQTILHATRRFTPSAMAKWSMWTTARADRRDEKGVGGRQGGGNVATVSRVDVCVSYANGMMGSSPTTIASTSSGQTILRQEPPLNTLSYGQVVYVDDGSCGPGKIKKVSAGRDSGNGIAPVQRVETCVPYRPGLAASPPVAAAPATKPQRQVVTAATPATPTTAIETVSTSAVPSSTAGAAPLTRRLARVIGNDKYANLPQLQKSDDDAKSYASLFESEGFARVVLLEDATRQQMDQAVSDFSDALHAGDTAVFVYAGHGWSDGTQNYLVGTDAPAEASQDFLKRISLPISNGVTGVLDEMNASGAALKVAIIDACRDNPFKSDGGTRSIGMQRGLDHMTEPASGTFVVYSAGVGQTALDQLSPADTDPNGVFTRTFVPLLRRHLTLLDATKQAQAAVYALAKSVDHEQQPAFYDETLGDAACLSSQ